MSDFIYTNGFLKPNYSSWLYVNLCLPNKTFRPSNYAHCLIQKLTKTNRGSNAPH